MANNNRRAIRERREKIRQLLARGYSQGDIMSELRITTATYNRDMKSINEMWRKEFYELAKASPLKIFNDYENDLGKITKECWKIHNDPNTPVNDKLSALRLMSELNEEINNTKFSMFEHGYYHHDHDMT
jgi:hypothetical protein